MVQRTKFSLAALSTPGNRFAEVGRSNVGEPADAFLLGDNVQERTEKYFRDIHPKFRLRYPVLFISCLCSCKVINVLPLVSVHLRSLACERKHITADTSVGQMIFV